MKFDELINDETEYGEPQWWLYGLDRDRVLEVTHEEYGLPKSEQFYSCRVHCSKTEFENGDYHGACGIISEICIDTFDFDYDKIVKWAEKVAATID